MNKKQMEDAALVALENNWRKKLDSKGLRNVKLNKVRRAGKDIVELSGNDGDIIKAKKLLGIDK